MDGVLAEHVGFLVGVNYARLNTALVPKNRDGESERHGKLLGNFFHQGSIQCANDFGAISPRNLSSCPLLPGKVVLLKSGAAYRMVATACPQRRKLGVV